MQYQKILVTGGAGFIGSNFVRDALQNNSSLKYLINLDLLTYAGNLENLKEWSSDSRYQFVQADIGDSKKIIQLLQEHQIEAILNFAAESHVDRSIDSAEPFFETNVMGTLRLLEAARSYWKSLPADKAQNFRFLHISTDEVYGSLSLEDPAFSESTPFAPNSPYAASKAGSDHLVRSFHHTYGLPTLTTNCSNNYGPYQFPEKLIPLIILNALDEKPLPIYGDGMNIRDWLYVGDHCRAIAMVLENGKPGETYNVGGNSETPNIQIVDTLCSLLDELQPRANGKSYRDLKTFVKDRPGHDRRYAINFTKIKTELSWTPHESLATGMRKTVQWYLDHRSWCNRITEQKYSRDRLGQKA
ncbi:MAG: dTDP-glucose 4,6-dehydratase [Verrucomicrobiota bacterium]